MSGVSVGLRELLESLDRGRRVGVDLDDRGGGARQFLRIDPVGHRRDAEVQREARDARADQRRRSPLRPR